MKAEETLNRKLAYNKPKFWRFRGLIETNVIFPLNFERNTQKKEKNFEFLFCFYFDCFVLSKN
jgi:hypothetical protein